MFKQCSFAMIVTMGFLCAESDQYERVDLFRSRNIEEKIKEQFSDISDERAKELCALFYQQAGYANKREIGHDEKRVEVYTGREVKPQFVVLTRSGQDSLQETIEALKKRKLAHNFVIDVDGNIIFAGMEDEDLATALQHRPHAVGVSAYNNKGFEQIRDMNSHVISISIVGTDEEAMTEEQKKCLIKLCSSLSKEYDIAADHFLDYGRVAYPYHDGRPGGKRTPHKSLAYKELATYGIGLWPENSMDTPNNCTVVDNEDAYVVYVSAALAKLGYVCPMIKSIDQEDSAQVIAFRQALTIFQQQYECDQHPGEITEKTIQALYSLVEQINKLHKDMRSVYP